MIDVSTARCLDYSDVAQSYDRLFNALGGLENLITPGSKVLVKPNLVFNVAPKKSATTHPSLVENLCSRLVDMGCKVLVGDSPFFGKTNRWWDRTKVVKAALKGGAKIENFTRVVDVDVKNPVVQKTFGVAAVTQEVDHIISLAKLKMHKQCVFTGSVKNNYGLVVGPTKGLIHLKMKTPERFANMLLDLYKTLPPCLGIIDGVVGMEGDGPGSGDPKGANFIGASKVPLALDWIAAKQVGLDPALVPHLQLATTRDDIGLNSDIINVVGDDVQKVDFAMATPSEINFMPKFVARYVSGSK